MLNGKYHSGTAFLLYAIVYDCAMIVEMRTVGDIHYMNMAFHPNVYCRKGEMKSLTSKTVFFYLYIEDLPSMAQIQCHRIKLFSTFSAYTWFRWLFWCFGCAFRWPATYDSGHVTITM